MIIKSFYADISTQGFELLCEERNAALPVFFAELSNGSEGFWSTWSGRRLKVRRWKGEERVIVIILDSEENFDSCCANYQCMVQR
jgi:hypothetical protein